MDDIDTLARGYAVLGQILLWGLILFLLACPICSAILAHAKGRDVAGWFVAGLIFGPFGLIAAAGMPTSDESENIKARRGRSSSKLLCPACYEPTQREAHVCSQCGTDFAEWQSHQTGEGISA